MTCKLAAIHLVYFQPSIYAMLAPPIPVLKVSVVDDISTFLLFCVFITLFDVKALNFVNLLIIMVMIEGLENHLINVHYELPGIFRIPTFYILGFSNR